MTLFSQGAACSLLSYNLQMKYHVLSEAQNTQTHILTHIFKDRD